MNNELQNNCFKSSVKVSFPQHASIFFYNKLNT